MAIDMKKLAEMRKKRNEDDAARICAELHQQVVDNPCGEEFQVERDGASDEACEMVGREYVGAGWEIEIDDDRLVVRPSIS